MFIREKKTGIFVHNLFQSAITIHLNIYFLLDVLVNCRC